MSAIIRSFLVPPSLSLAAGLLALVTSLIPSISVGQGPQAIPLSRTELTRASSAAITELVWTPDGLLYSGDWDGNICVWKPGRKTTVKSFDVAGNFIRSLGVLEKGARYIACLNDGVVIGKLPSGIVQDKFSRIPDGQGYNSRALLSPDEKTVVVQVGFTAAKIFSTSTLQETGRLKMPENGPVGNIAFTPSGGLLVCSTELLHFPPGQMTHDFSLPLRGDAIAIECSPDARMVAVASMSQVSVAELKAGAPVRTLTTKAGALEAVVWSPDGRRIAATGASGVVEFFDPATGALKETLTILPGQTSSLAFSPDGKWLAIGGGHYLDRTLTPARKMTGDNTIRLLSVNFPPPKGR
ncbi:MAG: WD40 repeat domain-containing protein [Verrucomicrobiota bacterium]